MCLIPECRTMQHARITNNSAVTCTRKCILGVVVLFTISQFGCIGDNGPATTDTSSQSFAALEQRIDFLERYVSFRRTYIELDFHIWFSNNSGGLVPGPTEWDIRLIAKVPPNEIDSWLAPELIPSPDIEKEWLQKIPGSEQALGITEWYSKQGLIVGVDRERSLVAFHRCSY